jgi:3-deoxy-D-manno-octulosonate 8-phosphate phosphatase (KDO 8-P phosphatase)
VPSAKLSAKTKRVRLLLLDVDGVLTDGRLYIGEVVGTDGRSLGVELKAFHIQDGHAMKMAARGGLLVGWVSSRHSAVTARRAKELGIRLLSQPEPGSSAPPPKLDVVRRIAAQEDIGLDEVCFVGDDLVDLPAMAHVGLAIAVANAAPEVRRAALYVTRRPGGDGAVREVIELILKSQNKWDSLLERYRAEMP